MSAYSHIRMLADLAELYGIGPCEWEQCVSRETLDNIKMLLFEWEARGKKDECECLDSHLLCPLRRHNYVTFEDQARAVGTVRFGDPQVDDGAKSIKVGKTDDTRRHQHSIAQQQRPPDHLILPVAKRTSKKTTE